MTDGNTISLLKNDFFKKKKKKDWKGFWPFYS